jgi:hypothetical protein
VAICVGVGSGRSGFGGPGAHARCCARSGHCVDISIDMTVGVKRMRLIVVLSLGLILLSMRWNGVWCAGSCGPIWCGGIGVSFWWLCRDSGRLWVSAVL